VLIQATEIIGGLGLVPNVAAAVWLVYGGAKLWQTLRGGNGNGKAVAAQLRWLREQLKEDVADANTLLLARFELLIGNAIREARRG